MIGIYKITSPSGKVYIGSSINIESRLYHYRSLDCKGQRKLYNSIRKYGWDSHIVEILCECTVQELHNKELEFGCMYDVLGNRGLNCALPKAGTDRQGVSDDTIAKMRIAQSGNNNNFFGRKHTSSSKESLRKAQLGRKHSIEHRRKVSVNHSKHCSKPVLDLLTGVFYSSAKELSDLYSIKHSTLRAKLNGRLKNDSQFVYA